MERDPTMRGDDFKEMKERYRAMAKTLKEVQPYACSGDCLNSSLRRKAAEKDKQ
jgi:hypothetical protein